MSAVPASDFDDAHQGELEREAAYVAMLYERLDAYRAEQERRLAEVRLAPKGGTFQARTERDILARQLEQRLDAIAIGDLPLCFGRIDLDDGSRLYVGRVGLSGEGDDPLLMDWRAPKAALFYSATSGSPQGVVRRRHLITHGRELVGIDDEVFDLEAFPDTAAHELHGDAALLAALSRERTGHMRDIVATIQQEQDAVIRSELDGALVVQGGPGTGKTAVALHRAAYLLYTHRSRLAQSGVLVVGPNPVFLRYIEQVLPSLGETGAVMASARSLFPGVRAVGHDTDATADLKGRTVMAQVIANAIVDRERRPREDASIEFERTHLVITRSQLEHARRRGQRSRYPHNQARRAVEASVLDAAMARFRQIRSGDGMPEPTQEELNDVRHGIRRTRAFRSVMERMWPVLSPQQLLNDCFGTPALVRSATRGVAGVDAELLGRDRGPDPDRAPWTIEDVPLLDEAAEQLGSWTEAADRRAERRRANRRRREVEDARTYLQNANVGIEIDAERFAERFAEQSGPSVAELAANDRTWKFGHVIVDESQELSPMAWRALFRREPDRSMTVVGDLAQCGAAWAPSSWSEVLEPFATGRWRLVGLSTNYRTPTEIMDVANAVLAVAAPDAEPTIAIRSTGRPPRHHHVTPEALPAAVADAAEALLLGDVANGRVAVIAPDRLLVNLADALVARLGGDVDLQNPLGGSVALLGVGDSKGLEFDAVVLVEPSEIAARGGRGQNDLYVAFTRATQRLWVVHAGPLTSELEGRLEPMGVA